MERQADTSRETDARLERLRHEITNASGIPDAVWEDARRQLAGFLSGVQRLVEEVVLLGEPPAELTPSWSEPLPLAFAPSTKEGGGVPPSSAPAGATRGGAVWERSLAEVAEQVRRREISPVELTRAALDRITAHDGALQTFITVTGEAALDEARRAEREIGAGEYRGPLHGVPLAAKDLYATAGVRTTCGSAILRDWVPREDAFAIAAWKRAGAVIVGKNTLHEFAFGGTSVNEHTGTPRNPWNPAHMCGGSSGGSTAAVAAGFAYGAFGSETGNSVRRPASFCGVVGLKPTFGRVSRRGVFPLAWSLDHVGVFARTALDAALLAAPLSGYDPLDPGSRRVPAGEGDPRAALAPVEDLRGRRAGVPRALLAGIDQAIARAFERSLDGLRARGVEVVDVDLPLGSRWTSLASSITMQAEAAAVHARWLRERPHEYGHDVLARLLAGESLRTAEYGRAQAIRGGVAAELSDVLQAVDVLIAPGTPSPAPPLQGGALVPGDAPWGTEVSAFHLQRLFSVTGVPAAAAPCGRSADGLPLAIQVGGRPWEEGLVLGFAGAVMEDVPEGERLPAVAPLP